MPERGPISIAVGQYRNNDFTEVTRIIVGDAELFPPFAVHRCLIIADDLTLEGFAEDYTVSHIATGRSMVFPLTHVSAVAIARKWANVPGVVDLTTVEEWQNAADAPLVTTLFAVAEAVRGAERTRRDRAALAKSKR